MQLPDVAPIRDIVSLGLHSAGIPNRRPISIMLCSLPDNGKTTWVMDLFKINPGVHSFNTATRIGLAKWIFSNKRYERLHHIMIPDMTAPLAGEKSVAEAFQGFLMGLCYDGVRDMHTFNMPELKLDRDVILGCIAGITPATVDKRKETWADSGFLRRFLPLSYDYTAAQDLGVKHLISRGLNQHPAPIELNKELWNYKIEISNQHAEIMIGVAQNMVDEIGVTSGKIKGNTFIEILRTLLLTHAMRRGSIKVEDRDVEAIMRLSKYMNYLMNKVESLPFYLDPAQPAKALALYT